MTFREQADALAHTLKSLYGDLLEEPLLRAEFPRPEQGESLSSLAGEMRACRQCSFHLGRRNLVFGRGSPAGKIVFLGDAPSREDDASGAPFSDGAGELLHKMIVAMNLKPEETYLTHLFKCHPPSGQEVTASYSLPCQSHLEAQFRFLRATHIVALGEAASRALSRSEAPLNVLRGQTFEWNGRKVFCTHHPRDLLASPGLKKEAWSDLQRVMASLEGE